MKELIEAPGRALSAVMPEDANGWFGPAATLSIDRLSCEKL